MVMTHLVISQDNHGSAPNSAESAVITSDWWVNIMVASDIWVGSKWLKSDEVARI